MSASMVGHCSFRVTIDTYAVSISASVTTPAVTRSGSSDSAASVFAASISARYPRKSATCSLVMYGSNSSIISPPRGARSNIWNRNGATIKPRPTTSAATIGVRPPRVVMTLPSTVVPNNVDQSPLSAENGTADRAQGHRSCGSSARRSGRRGFDHRRCTSETNHVVEHQLRTRSPDTTPVGDRSEQLAGDTLLEPDHQGRHDRSEPHPFGERVLEQRDGSVHVPPTAECERRPLERMDRLRHATAAMGDRQRASGIVDCCIPGPTVDRGGTCTHERLRAGVEHAESFEVDDRLRQLVDLVVTEHQPTCGEPRPRVSASALVEVRADRHRRRQLLLRRDDLVPGEQRP